jgi:hypothetical protein
MKKNYLKIVISFLFIVLLTDLSKAQTFENGGAYMTYINNQYRQLMEDYMSYTSAVAHGKTARKIENRRKELINSVTEVTKKISAMPPYSGDKSLRDSTVKFLKITHAILNEDYGKIVNMEEVSEQSYDAMEAYYLAQDLAQLKLKNANDDLKLTEKNFVEKNKVNIIESGDELTDKLAVASQVSKYHRVVYLIFFKSYKQELYLMEAIDKKNINSIEQNKNTLMKYSIEGVSKLDTMKAFNGDKSIITACHQMLDFYKGECKDNLAVLSNFIIKEEDFKKIKKAFDSKRESDRTQADVDQFNKAVNDYNKSTNDFNNTNIQLATNRKKLIDNWNKTSQVFLDKHTPKYK